MNKAFLTLATVLMGMPLFADTPAAAPGREGGMTQTLIMIVVAVAFFYFILWRPEQKRRKALEQQRSSMKPGDRVTAMGIVGTLDSVRDQTVILKMVDGSKVEILKAAITSVDTSEVKS